METIDDCFSEFSHEDSNGDEFYNAVSNYKKAYEESYHDFFFRVRNSLSYHNLGKGPFIFNDQMIKTTYDVVKEAKEMDFSPALMLHSWVENNITYEDSSLPNGILGGTYKYKNALQTFNKRAGKCFDMAALYSTMAKIAGYNSSIADVTVSNSGKSICHACAWIEDENKTILVDPTSGMGFNIKHMEYEMFDDEDSIEYFHNLVLSINLKRENTICLDSKHIAALGISGLIISGIFASYFGLRNMDFHSVDYRHENVKIHKYDSKQHYEKPSKVSNSNNKTSKQKVQKKSNKKHNKKNNKSTYENKKYFVNNYKQKEVYKNDIKKPYSRTCHSNK